MPWSRSQPVHAPDPIWRNAVFTRFRAVVVGMALAGATMLAGCASGFYANVTSYQKWPADAAGQTYRIVLDEGQSVDNLEFQAVADMVRANIGSTGLVVQPRPRGLTCTCSTKTPRRKSGRSGMRTIITRGSLTAAITDGILVWAACGIARRWSWFPCRYTETR